ncbi:MAG: hypothetical protein RJB39_799 [Candidatus Parcubacteria bacterium]|jgi:hypothetical protein
MADEKKGDKKDDKKAAPAKTGISWEEITLLILGLITIFFVVIPRFNPETANEPATIYTSDTDGGFNVRGFYDKLVNPRTEVVKDSSGQVVVTNTEASLVDEATFRARDLFQNTFYFIFFLSIFLSLLFGLIWYHNKVRLKFIKDEYLKKIGLVKTPEQIKVEEAAALAKAQELSTPDTNGMRNQRWETVEKYYNSVNQSDWRTAIIEADIMLYDLLDTMSVEGISIGEKLKNMNKAQMSTIDFAWRSHRIRNDLAHQGLNFELTRRTVEEAIEGYRRVFNEFSYI